MIKINLLKSRVQDGQANNGGQAFSAGGIDDGKEKREALVKIVFIALFTAGLMLYESQNRQNLIEQQAVLQRQEADLAEQVAAKTIEVEGIKDIAKQAQELEAKLRVLKTLSKLRLREVKTLDFMQSSIPEKVWMKTLDYEAEENKIEIGHFKFTGNSVSTEDLTDFVKRLEDSAYLTEVIVLKNQEIAGPVRTGNMRDFQFTAEVETKN